jgi:outer membrane protein OmpA-like peptidoglycan-associated protein
MAGMRSRGPSVLMILALAGCSSVPDAVNPVEWYRSATDVFTSRSPTQPSATDSKMAEAQAKGTPNLASVPARPTRASTPAERQALTQGLVADRENAKYTDEDLQPRAAVAPPAASRSTPASPPPAPPSPAAPPPPPAPTQAGSVLQPAPAAPPAAAAPPPVPAAPAPTASTETTQPVPPPPPPTMPQVASTPAPPRAAAPRPAPAVQPSPPPPAVATAPRAQTPVVPASSPPPATPLPATVAEIYNRQLPGTAVPLATAPAIPAAASVDQVYRQQLARSESVVQLRQPAAEPPLPPPAQPRRGGALQHTAREPAKTQVVYVGGSTGIAPAVTIRAGEPVAVVRFGGTSARLGVSDRETLARIAGIAHELRGQVRIVGHAGRPSGGEGAKREFAEFSLSLDRANAVAQELMKNGIPAERLKVEAVGDAEPLVIAGSTTAEAANQRAEIFIE